MQRITGRLPLGVYGSSVLRSRFRTLNQRWRPMSSGGNEATEPSAGLLSQTQLHLISSRHCLKLCRESLSKVDPSVVPSVKEEHELSSAHEQVFTTVKLAKACSNEAGKAKEFLARLKAVESQSDFGRIAQDINVIETELKQCEERLGKASTDIIYQEVKVQKERNIHQHGLKQVVDEVYDEFVSSQAKKKQSGKQQISVGGEIDWTYFFDPVFVSNESIMMKGDVSFLKRVYHHAILVTCLQQHCRSYGLAEFVEGVKEAFCLFNVALAEKDQNALKRMLTDDLCKVVLNEQVLGDAPIDWKATAFEDCGGYNIREVFVTGVDIDRIDDDPVLTITAGIRADIQMEVINRETGKVIQDGSESKPYYCELEFYSQLPGESLDNLEWRIGAIGATDSLCQPKHFQANQHEKATLLYLSKASVDWALGSVCLKSLKQKGTSHCTRVYTNTLIYQEVYFKKRQSFEEA